MEMLRYQLIRDKKIPPVRYSVPDRRDLYECAPHTRLMLCYLTLFLLLLTAAPAKPNTLAANSAIHNAIWLLSPV